MGTNNRHVVSHMGVDGKPGASLRAFRQHLPNAQIYGADIDKSILFQEDRIQTFFVDQTEPSSFLDLERRVPSDLDLIIDDGLHSPDANLESLRFGLQKIKIGGWFIVEDICPEAVPLWQVVSALLISERLEAHLYRAQGGYVFAVKRLT